MNFIQTLRLRLSKSKHLLSDLNLMAILCTQAIYGFSFINKKIGKIKTT